MAPGACWGSRVLLGVCLLAAALFSPAAAADAASGCPMAAGNARISIQQDEANYPIYPPAEFRATSSNNSNNFSIMCSGSWCVKLDLESVPNAYPQFVTTDNVVRTWQPKIAGTPQGDGYDPRYKDWAGVVSVCRALFKYEKRFAGFFTRASFHDALSLDAVKCSKDPTSCGGADASLFLTLEELVRGENSQHHTAFLAGQAAIKIAAWFDTSVADVLAVCAGEAPAFISKGRAKIIGYDGKKNFKVGRLDSVTPAPPFKLVPPTATLEEWAGFWKALNFTLAEASALMGSHTLLEPQACYMGPEYNNAECDPLYRDCTNVQMFRWDNHYYRDICTPTITVKPFDNSSLVDEGLQITVRKEMCKFTSLEFRNLALWEINHQSTAEPNFGNPPFTVTWDNNNCSAAEPWYPPPTPSAPYPPEGYSSYSSSSYSAPVSASSYSTPSISAYDGQGLGAAVRSSGLGGGGILGGQKQDDGASGKKQQQDDGSKQVVYPTTTAGQKQQADDYSSAPVKPVSNCPHAGTWFYTFNDAFLGQACQDTNATATTDVLDVHDAMKTFFKDWKAWDDTYRTAYIKMVSTWTKYVNLAGVGDEGIYIDGSECPSGYVVHPLYYKSGSGSQYQQYPAQSQQYDQKQVVVKKEDGGAVYSGDDEEAKKDDDSIKNDDDGGVVKKADDGSSGKKVQYDGNSGSSSYAADYAQKKSMCSLCSTSGKCPAYCMCRTAFVHVSDLFGYSARADGLPVDPATIPI